MLRWSDIFCGTNCCHRDAKQRLNEQDGGNVPKGISFFLIQYILFSSAFSVAWQWWGEKLCWNWILHQVKYLFLGIVIEEIVEENNPTSTNISASRPQEFVENSKTADTYKKSINSESLQGLKDDPEAIRSACFSLGFST